MRGQDEKDTPAVTTLPLAEPNVFLPHGRIGRATYATRWFGISLIYGAFDLLEKAFEGSLPHALETCILWLLMIFFVITLIKRLHDVGYSAGALIIFWLLAPLLLFLPGEPTTNAFGSPPTKPFAR